MRRFKYAVVLILLITLSGCLFACTKDDLKPSSSDITDIELVDDDPEGPTVTGGPESVPVTLRYYTVQTSDNSVIAAVSMVPAGSVITPQLIINYVVDSLEDESISLSLPSAELKNGRCTVCFDSSIFKIANKDSNLETAVLDAIAQSILDNVADCQQISLSIDGRDYDTANLYFGINDIYMDNEL